MDVFVTAQLRVSDKTIKVDFQRPGKKMKKRRELDALVNGKSSSKKKRKGQHDLLLDNMSDSSETEFSITSKPIVRK